MSILGYNTTGASQDNPADNVVWMGPYSPAADGTLTAISAVCSQRLGPSPTVAFALYSGTTSAPTTLVATSTDAAVAVGASQATASQSFSQSITAATHYWLAVRGPAYLGGGSPQNDLWVQYDGNTDTAYFLSSSSFPSTVSGATSFNNEQWTLYGTYSTAGATGTGALTLGTPAVSGSGSVSIALTGAVTLQTPSVSGSGTEAGSGAAAVTLQTPSVAAAGWAEVFGTSAITLQGLSVAGTGGNLPVNFYHTAFPNTENPISEQNVWTNGHADGLDWTDNRTTTNKAFGTQTGNNTGTGVGVTPSRYDDSISVLKGTFGADQYAKATVFNGVPGGDYGTEVELLLRFAITAHNARGYEIEFSVNPNNSTGRGGYFDIVRWNGQVGDFTPLLHLDQGQTAAGSSVASRALVTGDVVEAWIIGSTITVHLNGAFFASVTDSTWTTGNPGFGHYLNNGSQSADVTSYGFSDYTGETWVTGTGAVTLQSLSIEGHNTFQGSGGVSLQTPSLAGSGSVTFLGTGAVTLQTPSLSVSGFETAAGPAAVTLNTPAVSGFGLVSGSGVGVITLRSPTIAGAGVASTPFTGDVAQISLFGVRKTTISFFTR